MQERESGTFNIVRHYANGKPNKIMQRGLSWSQTQRWVNDESTQKEGEWFDGFEQTV